MRSPIAHDLSSMDRYTFLTHSVYGAGKTHLLGDALRYYAAQGGSVRFVNIKGQDGYRSVAGLVDLAAIGETIDDYADWEALTADYPKRGLKCVGLDGIQDLAYLVIQKQVGNRMPRTGDAKNNEWGDVHFTARNVYRTLRTLADVVLVTCPSDRYKDPVTGEERINPDMPGAQSRTVVGEFDFVGYLKATTMGANRIDRVLQLQPMTNVATRQRLPRPITEDIKIPEGGGGWETFLAAVQRTLTPKEKAK